MPTNGTMVDRKPLESFPGVAPRTPEAVELRWLLNTGIHLIGADEGSLLAYDEAKRVLRFVLTAGNRASERNLIGQTLPLGAGLTGLAAQLREVQVGAPKYHKISQIGRRGSVSGEPQAVIAAPMISGDILLGVMTAVRFGRNTLFTMDEAKLIGRFAAVAGLVIEQDRRLKALAARSERQGPDKSRPADKNERKIMASVANIRRRKPRAMAQLARAIGAMETLIVGEAGDGDAAP